MAEGTLNTILRKLVIIALFIYFATRVYVAYSKLDAGKIGTLFNRITETTVQVVTHVTWRFAIARFEVNSIISVKKLVSRNHFMCLPRN